MKKTDIIIFSGQSNMQGQTESLMSTVPVPDALEYRYNENALIPLRHPVGETVGENLLLGAHESHGSLIPDFCRGYMEQTGRPVVAVHAAKGATIIADWLPPCPRFDALIDKCRGAIAAVGEENVGRVWFVWLQGESDALISLDQETYEARVCTFRDALVERLPIEAFTIIRVAKFADDERDIPILKAQEALCTKPGFVMLTRLTGIFTNDPDKWTNPFARAHYNNAAMTLLGETAGRNLGRYADGLPFELEHDPYPEVAE